MAYRCFWVPCPAASETTSPCIDSESARPVLPQKGIEGPYLGAKWTTVSQSRAF